MTHCTFHPDNNPSMSLVKQDDGRWTYKCFGCDASGDTIRYIEKTKDMTFNDAVLYLIKEARQAPPRPVPVKYYDYCDENGELLYQIVRYEPKGFRPRRKTGNGWEYCMDGCRRVLYRLPEARQRMQEPVYYAEGEKDVESLVGLGLVATTNPFGAKSFRPELLEDLRQTKLVVVPQNDEPGKDLMRKVFAAWRKLGKEAGFLLIPAQYKDVSDYLAAGGTKEELLSWVK